MYSVTDLAEIVKTAWKDYSTAHFLSSRLPAPKHAPSVSKTAAYFFFADFLQRRSQAHMQWLQASKWK